jgi:hypothetical protein
VVQKVRGMVIKVVRVIAEALEVNSGGSRSVKDAHLNSEQRVRLIKLGVRLRVLRGVRSIKMLS